MIYDISQEVFSCEVYPGDPAPERKTLSSISEGAPCNLSAITMCCHNGTHVDAPYHFVEPGKKIHELPLDIFVGPALVWQRNGEITALDADYLMKMAAMLEAPERLLLKGSPIITPDAARVFVRKGLRLLGVESQSVGPMEAPAEIHNILLWAEVIPLEGLRLQDVKPGVYQLFAAPLNLSGADGAPCRAVLVDMPEKAGKKKDKTDLGGNYGYFD